MSDYVKIIDGSSVTVAENSVSIIDSFAPVPGPPGPIGDQIIITVPYDEWPPADPQPEVLYLRLAP